MPLNLRRLRKGASYTADHLHLEGPLTATQLHTPSGNVQELLDSHSGQINAINTSLHGHANTYERVCFVDSKRTDSYTEDGGRDTPYKTLSGAMTLLGEGETDTIIFRLASGDYDGEISVSRSTSEQSFSIIGSGTEHTYIRGSSSWDATTGNVLFFKAFVSVTIRDCAIQNGAYGVYARLCDQVKIMNCTFLDLGSSGVGHELTRTQAELAAYWSTQEPQIASDQTEEPVVSGRWAMSRLKIVLCHIHCGG